MQTVHMIGDYRLLCQETEQAGKYEAYKAYTQKYPGFFEGVFKYLYCQPIESLKSMIESVDFYKLLNIAENNYDSGMVDYTLACAKAFSEKMHVDFDFTLFLGLELSNIGGCATPGETEGPCLYIGVDRPLDKEWVRVFVPHELLHMLRRQGEPQENVFSRTVEEGLASNASLWSNEMAWNVTNVAKALGVSEKQAGNLMTHTKELLNKLISDGEKPISVETMKEYFVMESSETELPVVGYYVGLYLTHLSVQNGVDFEGLASMPCAEIVNMWFK